MAVIAALVAVALVPVMTAMTVTALEALIRAVFFSSWRRVHQMSVRWE